DEQTLIGANGLHLLGGPPRLEGIGGPVVQRLVELLDGGVLDLAALLVEGVEDGGELLRSTLLGADWGRDEGLGQNPGCSGRRGTRGVCVWLRGYLRVLFVGVAVVAQRGEAIDERSDVALGGHCGTVEDGSPVRGRGDQRRHVRDRGWEGNVGKDGSCAGTRRKSRPRSGGGLSGPFSGSGGGGLCLCELLHEGSHASEGGSEGRQSKGLGCSSGCCSTLGCRRGRAPWSLSHWGRRRCRG